MALQNTTIDKTVAIEEVKKWIEFIMKRKGWNGTELANAAGVAPSTVLRMFSKKNYTFLSSLTTIGAIASASNIKPPESLMAAYGVQNVGMEAEVSAPAAGRMHQARSQRSLVAANANARDGYGEKAAVGDGITREPTAEPAKPMIKVRHVSPLPFEIRRIENSGMQDVAESVEAPPSLAKDDSAFAFRLKETVFEPVVPFGTLMFATQSRDVVPNDMILITRKDKKSFVRVLKDLNEKEVMVTKGGDGKIESMPFDEIDSISIVVGSQRK